MTYLDLSSVQRKLQEMADKVLRERPNAPYRCPVCQHIVFRYDGDYCPNCGQRLGWPKERKR